MPRMESGLSIQVHERETHGTEPQPEVHSQSTYSLHVGENEMKATLYKLLKFGGCSLPLKMTITVMYFLLCFLCNICHFLYIWP